MSVINDLNSKCPYCDFFITTRRWATAHFKRKHPTENRKDYEWFIYSGSFEPKLCECGRCNEELTPKGYKVGIRFRVGHFVKIRKNNPWFNKERINNGKIQINIELFGENNIHIPNTVIKERKHKFSDETRKRMSDSKFRFYANETPEHKQKRAETKAKWHAENKRSVSKLEMGVRKTLEAIGIKFIHQYRIDEKVFDFWIRDTNILVECDGDFWHANPSTKYYPPQYESVIKNLEKDIIKNKYAKENGYLLLRFWETDILNNPDLVVDTITNILNKPKWGSLILDSLDLY